MQENPVISNTSPLIGLWGLNLLSLLRDLYTEVWIPREVEKEFLGTERVVHQKVLNNAPWIKTVDLAAPESTLVYDRLDSGEAEVLALAKTHKARLVIIDEQKARREARKIGLPSKGIVGVLLEAKESSLVGVIKPLLIALRENGIYLSDSVIADALEEAGEV